MKRKLYALMVAALSTAGANAQIISTYAGTGTVFGYGGDGGPATACKLYSPGASVVDAAGNLYIADKGNNRVRKVDAAGNISTFAGTNGGLSGDGGSATAAQLNAPLSVALDAAGNLYIADYGNSRIRKVSTAGIITTFAGTTSGMSGDGGAATAASISSPTDLSVDGAGNVFICDYGNNCIRKVNTSGIISTVVGTGVNGYNGDGIAATAAQLNNPNGVFADQWGNLFVADRGNNRVRKVNSAGTITTIAGSGVIGYAGDNGPATAASLNAPVFVVADAAGNVFFSDMQNFVVRRVGVNDTITTVVGNNTNGYSGDGGLANAAELSYPTGVTFDAANNLYITEQGNYVVRKVAAIPVTITGTTTVCVNANTTLSQSISDDGVWLSSNSGVATVNRLTGVVTGVSAGTATISFSLGGGLGTTLVTVNPLPVAGAISGVNTECIGGGNMLGATVTGGVWSSSNTTVATVSATGTVSGLAAGSITISYTVTNSCGSASATFPFTVVDCTTGFAAQGIDNAISVFPNPANGSFSITLPASATMPAHITLVNSVGQVVSEVKATDNNMVMIDAHVHPGTYLLSVTTPNAHFTTRVMISE